MGSCHAEVGGLGRGGNGWGRVLEGKGPGRRWGRTGEVKGEGHGGLVGQGPGRRWGRIGEVKGKGMEVW